MYKLFLLFFAITCFSQSPINVQITGTCLPVSGVFDYIGVLNGKNNYLHTFVNPEGTATIYVAYDGIKWVLHNGTITDAGFINTTITSTLTPPLSGWLVANCGAGTMIISSSLSNKTYNQNKFKIFPSPSSDSIIINSIESKYVKFDYKIFDMLGRAINSGNSNFEEKINIEELKLGNYFIQITDDTNNSSVQKFIKK